MISQPIVSFCFACFLLKFPSITHGLGFSLGFRDLIIGSINGLGPLTIRSLEARVLGLEFIGLQGWGLSGSGVEAILFPSMQ